MRSFQAGADVCTLFEHGTPPFALPGFSINRFLQVAQITTFSFLVTYVVTNLACFVCSVTGAPNFRPEFRYYHWSTALLGVVLSLFLCIRIDPLVGLIAIFFTFVLWIFIYWKHPGAISLLAVCILAH